MYRLNELNDLIESECIKTLILSSSFESRSTQLYSIVRNKIDSLRIFRNVDSYIDIINNSEEIFNNSELKDKKILDLKCNSPVETFFSILDEVKSLLGVKNNLLIDVTAFTKESLLILLRIIQFYKSERNNVYLSYTSAKSYNSEWLTKGNKDLRTVIGYPGFSDPSKKNHLLIIVGFELERTESLINKYEFDRITLAFANSEDSINKEFQIENYRNHQELSKSLSNTSELQISLKNPFSTKETIIGYLNDYQDYNNVIAPMNNKISTVGAGLAAIENPKIQISYLQPLHYNIEQYSEPGDEFYIWKL